MPAVVEDYEVIYKHIVQNDLKIKSGLQQYLCCIRKLYEPKIRSNLNNTKNKFITATFPGHSRFTKRLRRKPSPTQVLHIKWKLKYQSHVLEQQLDLKYLFKK